MILYHHGTNFPDGYRPMVAAIAALPLALGQAGPALAAPPAAAAAGSWAGLWPGGITASLVRLKSKSSIAMG